MARILLVDDDVELCELLSEYLTNDGFEVDTAHDGEAAVARVREAPYELVVLDVMMPKRNGFDALRDIRADSRVPVLMLTARGDDVDRIVGLEMGADDYLPKPCNPRELVARIRAILRRVQPSAPPGEAPRLRVGDVELDAGTRTCRVGGEDVALTGAEFNVLAALLRSAGRVLGKDALTEEALGRKLGRYDRSIDVHVSSLRRKLGAAPGGAARFKTVRGVGYIYLRPGED